MLTVKNRLKEPFVGMYDGQTYEVKTTLTLPDAVAWHLKNQSIYRENPISGEREFRLAIVEREEDDSPLSFEDLPIETLDRSDTDFPKVQYKNMKNRTVPEQRGSGRLDSTPISKER